METGVYEAWVSRLVAWGEDPKVSLANLPTITEESFPPSTFSRLLKHIEKAMSKLMDRWQGDLEKGLRTMRNEHDLSNVLVHARNLLAKRVELANHPALPEKMREALMEETKTSINDLQAQLEKGVSSGTSSWSIDSNKLLRVVKATPLTVVLNPEYGARTRVMQVVDAAEQYNQQIAAQQQAQMQQVQAQPPKNGGFFARFRGKK